MKKLSKKDIANQISQEIAFNGPLLMKTLNEQYFYVPTLHPSGKFYYPNSDKLPAGTVVLLLRGPLPCGEHKSSEGGRFWFVTPVGIRFTNFNGYYNPDLNQHFKRI